MNLDLAPTLKQSFDSHNSLIDLHDSISQHHGSSTTSLSQAIHPQHSQEYVKAMHHLTESMKRTEESRSRVINLLSSRQSASAVTTPPAATVIPEVPQVVAPISVTPPPLGMDIDCGDSIMDDNGMEDDMMWFIDDPITTEKFEQLPPLTKQHDQELSWQQQHTLQPSAGLSRPTEKEPSLKYIKLAQFLNGSRGTLTGGLQESRQQLGYEVVWIKNQQCEQIE